LLGVTSGATEAQLKAAYRRLAKVRHPDAGGSDKAFQELQKAYELLTAPQPGKGRQRHRESPPSEDDGEPLQVGHWFTVRSLQIDNRMVRGARAQLVVLDMEILIALYLAEPWGGTTGSVTVYLSERPEDPEMAQYQRPVVQRSSEREGVTALWFSPFDKRMRIDGYEVGKEPVEVEPNPAFRREPKRWWG
jgi:curved DNA-binding protein CbpA